VVPLTLSNEDEITPGRQHGVHSPDGEGDAEPKQTRRTALIIVLVLVAVSIVGVVLLGMAVAPWLSLGSHPSDDEMITSFKDHRAEYEELLRLFQEHRKLSSMAASTGTVPNAKKAGVSGAQAASYRELMKQLGVQAIERYFGKILFVTSTEGLAVSGSMKGYVFAKQPPSPVVEDSERDAVEPVGENYRHIVDGWYIIYEWDT
jgi:hypothetical protein